MAETKYGKYIVSEMKKDLIEAPWASEFTAEKNLRMIFLDNDVIQGAFYLECVWVWPQDHTKEKIDINSTASGTQPHSHDFDEVIAFFGTDFKNPKDLGGEVELWLGDEKHIITRSSVVFIPKGLIHCPLIFRKVDRPIFHFTTGPGQQYR